MQAGQTLQSLAATLSHAKRDARDYVVPAAKLQATVVEENGAPKLKLAFESHTASLNPWSASQLASYTEVPKAYFDRLAAENPTLAARNVNHGLERANGDRRMVRMLDDQLRALVSPKYRRLDSADLAETLIPIFAQANLEIVSSSLTDRRFYLRATSPRLQADVGVGDTVQAGIMVSNSDVGAGSLRVEPFLVRLVCMNGMVREHAFKKAHVGRALGGGDDNVELLSESTLRLTEQAIFAELADVTRACLAPALFEREVDKLRAAAGRPLKNFDLQQVVDVTCKTVGLTASKGLQGSILDALASGNQGAGLTAWGLANAFTAAAVADGVDFDQAVELERAGGQIVDLSAAEWARIAEKRA